MIVKFSFSFFSLDFSTTFICNIFPKALLIALFPFLVLFLFVLYVFEQYFSSFIFLFSLAFVLFILLLEEKFCEILLIPFIFCISVESFKSVIIRKLSFILLFFLLLFLSFSIVFELILLLSILLLSV